jgi:hypothetical protein
MLGGCNLTSVRSVFFFLPTALGRAFREVMEGGRMGGGLATYRSAVGDGMVFACLLYTETGAPLNLSFSSASFIFVQSASIILLFAKRKKKQKNSTQNFQCNTESRCCAPSLGRASCFKNGSSLWKGGGASLTVNYDGDEGEGGVWKRGWKKTGARVLLRRER